ncbi:MAG: PHP domain-containing protein [Lachnospiraceae bacterium]|nr:PHP domain-containing protein [Lachnospiraceae bacterium]
MQIVDLHVHSNRSDGSFAPRELVDYAIEKGLSAFALTDHDTTLGLDEAIAYADERNRALDDAARLEVIPGIELSTEYLGKDVHILGLYIDQKNKYFQKYITDFQDSRTLRNVKMCAKLTEYGIPLTYEQLQDRFPGSILTRSHYAKYLLQEGYVRSMPEAFDRYVGDHAPCYLPREKVTPAQAVELILQAGGIPVLAHPILYHLSDAKLEGLVRELKDAGLAAIEAVYSTYKPAEERQIRALASKYGLLIGGGSDFHGTTKPGLDLAVGYGKLFIPYTILADMKTYLQDR